MFNVKWIPFFLFFLLLILFVPVLYYSLRTPFALVDDLGMCYYVEYLDSLKRFLKWLGEQFFQSNDSRYRPFFDLYNMVTWKIFGATPWLHHLSRWILHFASILTFVAAYRCFSPGQKHVDPKAMLRQNSSTHLLPVAFLIYIWLFFPNSPASRLGPQEVNTILFLGLCNWMIALILVKKPYRKISAHTIIIYFILFLGFFGLSISKETNIAIMLWILLFYYGLFSHDQNRRIIILGLPILLIFTFSLIKIYSVSQNSGYGVTPVTYDLILNNASWIFSELFQTQTSHLITIIFLFLLAVLVFFLVSNTIKRHFDLEFAFVIFLVGQFISAYLIVCTSWAQVLRYWYILVPMLSILLAFSVKYLLQIVNNSIQTLFAIFFISLNAFLLFFMACNYYNFLAQTIVQHSIRHAELNLINTISKLHDEKQYVQILNTKGDPNGELVAHLIYYFRRFSPRFSNKYYEIHTSPPNDVGQTYYLVTMSTVPGEREVHKRILPRKDYQILSTSYKLSGYLQGKKPYQSRDAGVHQLSGYKWIIYESVTK